MRDRIKNKKKKQYIDPTTGTEKVYPEGKDPIYREVHINESDEETTTTAAPAKDSKESAPNE